MVLLLTASVWAFPERRSAGNAGPQPPTSQQLKAQKLEKAREAPRDCKGKCASSIAQKAAAEAKAAQAAQNAAGAQAAHMVCIFLIILYTLGKHYSSSKKTIEVFIAREVIVLVSLYTNLSTNSIS